MAIQRLSESLLALYAELLDQSIHVEVERRARGLPPGTFVSKEIKGTRYWYLQVSLGTQKRQHYLGRETSALLEWMAKVTEGKRELAADESSCARLCAMLIEGGAVGESAPVVKVLKLLADAGVFRVGGVLVGTRAFNVYGNLLGVRFEPRALQTQDIDIVEDPAIAIALQEEPPVDVERALLDSGLGFFAVPALDRKQPSTSFKIRGRELRVDFLAPARTPREVAPRRIPGLGIFARPLPLLDYLMEGSIPAVVVGDSGVLVQTPAPVRFALHKLWTARQRPAAEQVRAIKDRRQAAALLDVLAEDRPHDLRLAWDALKNRTSAKRLIQGELRRLPDELQDRLRQSGLPLN